MTSLQTQNYRDSFASTNSTDEQLAKALQEAEIAVSRFNSLAPASSSILADTPVEVSYKDLERIQEEKAHLLALLAQTESASQKVEQKLATIPRRTSSASPVNNSMPSLISSVESLSVDAPQVELSRRPTFNTRTQARANRGMLQIITTPIKKEEIIQNVAKLPPAPASPESITRDQILNPVNHQSYVPPTFNKTQSSYNSQGAKKEVVVESKEIPKKTTSLFSFKRSTSPPKSKSTNDIQPSMIPNTTTRLDWAQSLDLYRQNALKSNNPKIQFQFAVFLVETAQDMPTQTLTERQSREALMEEGFRLLRKLAQSSCADAQYYLAVGYAHDNDFERSFALWLQASKHNHPASAYEVGRSYELGLGIKKDFKKAQQFYTKSASSGYVPAMYRQGLACLYGECGYKRDAKAALKWLKLGATAGDAQSKFTLASIYEVGAPPVAYQDLTYAKTLVLEAAEKGWAPAQVKLGHAYEYGRLGLTINPSHSIYWYRQAAEQGNAEAQFALAGWNLTGAENILPQSSRDALLWALKAAEQGLSKAEHAVGFFYETGVGCPVNLPLAKQWYTQAANHGDQRAQTRLMQLNHIRDEPRGIVKGEAVGQISVERVATDLKKSRNQGRDEQCRLM